MRIQRWLKAVAACTLLFAGWAPSAGAQLRVLACEPEWGALVEEIAGERARVSVATGPGQDPHRIEARPSLIAAARDADLLVCTGAELEIGWLPLLQRESGNPRIQNGQPGYFEAARHVRLIEVPDKLDRAMGDVHAAGNPHFNLNPHNLLPVAEALAARMAGIDPEGAAHYAEGAQRFAETWRAHIARWEARAAPLRGVPVAVHHKNWSYLLDWLGMRQVIDLEPKPGVDPSAAYLSQIVTSLKRTPARMVLRANYQPARPSRWVAERTGIPAVELPYTVGASERAADLPGLYDDLIDRLLGALS